MKFFFPLSNLGQKLLLIHYVFENSKVFYIYVWQKTLYIQILDMNNQVFEVVST